MAIKNTRGKLDVIGIETEMKKHNTRIRNATRIMSFQYNQLYLSQFGLPINRGGIGNIDDCQLAKDICKYIKDIPTDDYIYAVGSAVANNGITDSILHYEFQKKYIAAVLAVMEPSEYDTSLINYTALVHGNYFQTVWTFTHMTFDSEMVKILGQEEYYTIQDLYPVVTEGRVRTSLETEIPLGVIVKKTIVV